ncbi:glutaminyl-peptide cyclotransferase isoform X2 [Syzygium oleosum]|uniref:glutaminyl-peptide cyclotransferase isoform X2 n=1 Tax=Syzygium oleosum TaxID=219896 RepID=UPI0024BA647E|nr:glutaminyl-peptide cyclotransferase isoform X2 [Syzygium oleosum]
MAAKQKITRRPKLKPDSDVASPMPRSQRPDSRYRRIGFVLPVFLLLFVVGFAGIYSKWWGSFTVDDVSPGVYSIEVVREFPHDPQAFTQGLLYAENDTLYESTGLAGRSSVRKVALQSGKVEALQKMDRSYFGEGLTLLGERLFQVTWLQKTGFIYDRNNLSKFEEFTHEMKDGWGLATDGKMLFGTDGTSTLYQINPHNFRVMGKQVVRYRTHEVHNLNELEYINGEVWANIWQSDCIARISYKDGKVIGWILLQKLREGLITAGYNGIDVLNGIAWDNKEKRLFGNLSSLTCIFQHVVFIATSSCLYEQLIW